MDQEGNPYVPPDSVDYKIIDEDGSVLKEGTLQDTSEIPLDDVDSEKFRVIVSGHMVLKVDGFEEPDEEQTQEAPDGPSFDPVEDSRVEWYEEADDDSGSDASGDTSEDTTEGAGDDSGQSDGSSGGSSEESEAASGDDESSEEHEAASDESAENESDGEESGGEDNAGGETEQDDNAQ